MKQGAAVNEGLQHTEERVTTSFSKHAAKTSIHVPEYTTNNGGSRERRCKLMILERDVPAPQRPGDLFNLYREITEKSISLLITP